MRHHVVREINAHRTVTSALAATDDAQRLVAASRELGIAVVTYLPGELAEGTPAQFDPEMHRQAGALLARIHGQGSRPDDDYERRVTEQSREWLARQHRIPAATVRALRQILDAYDPPTVPTVPTHGDWHPRNWLVDAGRLRAIDFGRFAWRPAQTDLVRCWFNQWSGRPDLEAAFLEGYGGDPRDETWRIECLRQGVGTAVWAHMMGDEEFESEGLDMLARVLEAI